MAKYDLMIAGIAALSLILLIMMFITRSIVAALVIVGTVALSLGASFGLSVLVWQDLLGKPLYWVVLALAVILLLAVGSDYNLLLISRFKEEIGAGLNTGIIRAMASTGGVVTAAGLVFAFTMGSFAFSDLLVLGQIGTTIAGAVVRHSHRAVVHDTVDRRATGPLVLVAAARATATGQHDAAALRIPPRGAPTVAVGRLTHCQLRHIVSTLRSRFVSFATRVTLVTAPWYRRRPDQLRKNRMDHRDEHNLVLQLQRPRL